MNLPVVSHVEYSKGFTLVELLLVAALMLVVGTFMFPLGITFYRTQMLNETSEGIASTLRRAQSFALTGKNDSAYGVRVTNGSYVFFQGASYETRTVSEDEVYPIASTITLSGLDAIVFEPFSGMPDATGTIEVSNGVDVATVMIGGSGVIFH